MKAMIFATKPDVQNDVNSATFKNCYIDILWTAGDPLVVWPLVFQNVALKVTTNNPTLAEAAIWWKGTPNTIGNAYLHEMKELCSIYRSPSPTQPFTPSKTFTASRTFRREDGGGGGTPALKVTPKIEFSIGTAIGTGLGVILVASIFFAAMRTCCVFDISNYLKMDI
jgi:hypothetical protein